MPSLTRPAFVLARRILNTVNLTTPAGLVLARAGRCRLSPGPDGLLLAEGWSWVLPKAAAFTVGNVILYRSRVAASFRPGPAEQGGSHGSGASRQSPLLRHEARHSSQYAALGFLFYPLYFAAAGVSVLRKGDPASGNVFEQWAGLHDGGYRTAARRTGPRRRVM
ncbi:hypothetical protein KKR91_06015 [Arthrobacter jiangjiafuii]|uniref:DUF4157 domain-containing protein n=1 Tax=Arthrobacter jiangjiafuii TaxID=2817475 RepID=A0A975M818_9MICC|nr:hypothetical protein [Arthrobacter jiangjiafuii]MBP3044160.1 hypothetical protein [Arthrobacter jiangjiafuii]QWC11686.1 hypothetical protein KKR91_06015 [Arthrobacter jiangjiafuii]